ncbi:MAG: conjugal transfer protein TraG N-terminal domain-containing protein [Hydrogenophilales bacterium]|nr:conjugal transfer protein TraG N-terminal domain-containing protein [Hydrogenophilales bacterium]
MNGYTIYSYGDLDTLALIFNAIAAMMGGDSYLGAIAMVLILGFFGALIAMAAMKHLYGVQWLIAVFLINGVLLVPKTTVQIIDKTAAQAPVLVDNVPWGIGSLASIVTSTGSGLTELFETAFQTLPAVLTGNGMVTLPGSLTYERTGMMFGATLIQEASKTRFKDPVYETDLVNFIANCTIYDISQGLIDANAFNNSRDLWPLLANTNQARFTTLHGTGGSVDSYSCPVAYAALDASLATQVTNQIANMAVFVNPALKARIGQNVDAAMVNAASSELDTQLVAAYNRSALGGAAATTAQLIRQNGLINAVNGAGMIFSQRTNDPSALMLGMAQAQTTAAHNAQKIVGGKIAESALPLLHNGITAIVYTAFPLVILIALLMGGMGAIRVLKMYGLSMVWLAMWPPLYAVVNYLHSTKAAKATAMAGYANGIQGLTLTTAPTIYDTTMSELAITSWLLISVPVIASAIVFGMDKLANAGIGFMTAMGTSASFGSRQAGDYAGNLSLDKIDLAPNYTSAFMSQDTNALGTRSQDILNGDLRYRANLGQSAVSLGTSTEIGQRLGVASANAERIASQESEAAQRSHAATLTQIDGYTQRFGMDKVFGEGWRHGENASLATKLDRLHDIRDKLASDLKISDTAKASNLIALAISSPTLADIVPLAVKATGQQVNENQVTEALGRAREAAHAVGITDTKTLADEFVHSRDFQKRITQGDEHAKLIQAGHQETLTHTEASQRSHEESQEYRQSAERVMAMAARGEINWVPEFHNYVQRNALGAGGEYGIRDMGELTGDKAAYWMNKFFSEGEMGRTLDGSPAWMERAGFAPTRFPMAPEANSDLGDRYKAMPAPGLPSLDGKPITMEAVRDQYETDARQVVPMPPGWQDPAKKGAGVINEVEGAKAGNSKEIDRGRTEVKAGETGVQRDYTGKAGKISPHNSLWDDAGVVDEAKDKSKKLPGRSGGSGKW